MSPLDPTSEPIEETGEHRLPSRKRLDLSALRERLGERRGRDLWRSLEEIAASDEFDELLQREFPEQAAEWPRGVDRRRFLQLASASLAFGGLAACTKQPSEQIVPYVNQPEQIVPGRPLYYATALTLSGYATGVLAESHMGRPTKIEGNPDHPAGTGATDLFAQASILDLYDPDRSQVVRNLGRIRSWEAFLDETRSALTALDALGGARLRILTGTVTSPTEAALIRRVLDEHPKARWHQWEPVGRDEVGSAEIALFGQPVETRYDFSQARIVVSLDADFLTSGPGHLAYARDFMRLRRVRQGTATMNRLYAAESSPTTTATLADHRLPLSPSRIERLTLALAARLGIGGASTPDGFESGRRAAWVEAAARDLEAHQGAGLVIAGDSAPAAVHILTQAINRALRNFGTTVLHTEPVAAETVDQIESMASLTHDMTAGEVDVLVVVGGNPVYDAPADHEFHLAMEQVPRRIHLGLYENETAELCHWHVPRAHYLESWGDSRAVDGTVSLTQPLIEPLYEGKTAAELLAGVTAEGERSALDLVRKQWLGGAPDGDAEALWRKSLHDGFVGGTAAAPQRLEIDAAAVAAAVSALAQPAAKGLELIFRPDPTIYDGRFNNNGWLQECPKPLTKLTWDNAALVPPALAQRLSLANGDIAEFSVGGRSLEAAVWIAPGHCDDAVTLHLGYGRRRSGRIGSGTGFNAYSLRNSDALWAAPGLAISRSGGSYPLASTQLHSNIVQGTSDFHNLEGVEAERRNLVRSGTLEEFLHEPEFARHAGHTPDEALNLYPPFPYDGYKWGLAVDLSSCTGCNACVVACQSENNIPVVGKEQVALHREMHWIRIDRYYAGDLDGPDVHHQPVMCMHCEQAPCEVVCPVAATVHSDEGLNDMVYNRCVGTRYCSNNCPYKVRRFNFLKYTDDTTPSLKLQRNPDVTVRSRGVMEKCTYCVQRISHARIEAKKESRSIIDGEVLTACQQVCPTQAIAFGDLNDPESLVSRWKADPLNYGILEELNTRPRTSYLAKLTNPSHDLEETA